MPTTVVVKLGGSAITVKERPLVLRASVLDRAAAELAEAARRGIRLIIIHGGGSFGHPQAKAAGFGRRLDMLGASMTKAAVEALCLEVVNALIRRGLPAFPIHPSAIAVNDGGELSELRASVVSELLERGLVPVLHGDVVPDRSSGLSILSGDTLAARLAASLRASRLVFGLDVDGIYDRDPREPGARLIRELDLEAARRLSGFSASGVDVTGGILRKLSEAIRAAEVGVEVIFVSLFRPGALLEAVAEGRPAACTVIRPRAR